MTHTIRRFPAGFLWGTATSSHQVEGGNTNNQWWAWEQQPGRIWHGDVSGDACGWWEHAEQDLDRAAALGQNAHRMSVEWSRIEPQEGVFSPPAIARYRAILLAMRERGLTPMVTLHHFTNPLWLEARGGWLHRETPALFVRFVVYVLAELGDCCELWCTINEPTIYAGMSYLAGRWPPGATSVPLASRVMASMLRGHAGAAAAIHAAGPQHRVGLVHNLHVLDPSTPRNRDVLAARIQDTLFNEAILIALQTGRLIPPFGDGLRVVPGLRHSCDFVGLNYYSRSLVTFDHRLPRQLFSRSYLPDHAPASDIGGLGVAFGWIYPDGMYRALRRLNRLNIPIYITETGLPDHDDDVRPQFILSHLGAVYRAIQDGIDVRGVFLWSLIDNFEWADGWELRFGLYAFDQRTGERRLRPSGALYAIIARANALPADTATG